MLDINDIIDGTVVFMPSGIQATLYNPGDRIIVEYPDLVTNEYSKEDFCNIIKEGIVIFNQPSQMVMESKDILDMANKKAEYNYVVTGQNGINEKFVTLEDAKLYKQNMIDQGYSEYAMEIKPLKEEYEGSVFTAMQPKRYVSTEKKVMLLSKLQRIAKQFPDVHIRQQALSFLNDMGMQSYEHIDEIEKFVKKNIKLGESLNETDTQGEAYAFLWDACARFAYQKISELAKSYATVDEILKDADDLHIEGVAKEVAQDVLDGYKDCYRESIEELIAPRFCVVGMNLKRNAKEGIGIVWDKDFDDPREAMKFAQEKGKEEPEHVIELIDTIRDKVLYNSKNESLKESVEHDLVCPDCGALEIHNDDEDPHYYHCRCCGNVFHEDEAIEYCQYYESMNEETGPYLRYDDMAIIADEIEEGNKEGYAPYELGNWKLTTSLDEKWEALTNKMQDYILYEIAMPVRDGHIQYDGLNIVIGSGNSLEKDDLLSWGIWSDEEIQNMLEDKDELQAWIDYKIIYDEKIGDDLEESLNESVEGYVEVPGVTADSSKINAEDINGHILFTDEEAQAIANLQPGQKLILPNEAPDAMNNYEDGATEIIKVDMLGDIKPEEERIEKTPEEIPVEVEAEITNTNEQFKLKHKKKKKLDELNKEKEMNESYKVYSITGGESVEQGDFNSWQEVEQFLNAEWGSYSNQMCKENPSFAQSEEDKLNFFANYDIVPIEVEVAPDLGTNGTECPNCGCIDCICDGTTCEVDTNLEVTPEGEIIDPTIEPAAEVVTMIEPVEVIEQPVAETPAEPVEQEELSDEDLFAKAEKELGIEYKSEEDKEEGEIKEEPIEESLNEEEEPKYIINAFDEHGEVEQIKCDDVITASNEYQKINGKAYKELVDCTRDEDLILASEGEMPQKQVQEEFNDTMAMTTEVSQMDFPQALKDAIPTKEDGTLFTIEDLAKELKEVKSQFEQQISDFKNDLKLALQDIKQDIKSEINNVSNSVSNVKDELGSIPDAIEDISAEEMEDLENVEYEEPEMGEEPVEEPEEEEETEKEKQEESYQPANQSSRVLLKGGIEAEVVDIKFAEGGQIKSYVVKKAGEDDTTEVDPDDVKDVIQEEEIKEEKSDLRNGITHSESSLISQFTSKGFMEDLGSLNNRIDQMLKDNSPIEKVKDTIELLAKNDKEKEDATNHAADQIKNESVMSIKESLLSTSYNSQIGFMTGAGHRGIDLPKKR